MDSGMLIHHRKYVGSDLFTYIVYQTVHNLGSSVPWNRIPSSHFPAAKTF